MWQNIYNEGIWEDTQEDKRNAVNWELEAENEI